MRMLSGYGEVDRGPLAVPVDDVPGPRRRLTRRVAAGLTAREAQTMTDAYAERSTRRRGPRRARRRASRGYGRGARILSIGIAATGVFTFAYFALASHVLDADLYGSIALLWAILFVVISVLYRPVEQLLSRTIADASRARLHGGHPLRVPLSIQGGFALAFLVDGAGAERRARRRLRRLGGAGVDLHRRRRRVRGAATSRAATSPATSGSASTAAWCCSSRSRASASRSPSRSGSRAVRRPSRSASSRRRSPRCSWSRGRSRVTGASTPRRPLPSRR